MSKRQKFIIATLVLLIGIILSRLGLGGFIQWRFRVVIFSLLSVAASVWALHDEDFAGIEWLTLPILPAMFAIAGVLVFPLMPSGFDTILTFNITADTSWLLALLLKILFLVGFMIGYYASVLTANIYNIAAIRNIQLLRVAHSVGFLITVATALLFYIVIFSLHLLSFYNFFLIFIVSLPLSFQSIWSVSLETKISDNTRNFSLAVAIILGEIAWVLSFWPVGISIMALFLTSIFYEIVGIVQYHFGERLNSKVINEFITVAIFVFLITIFTAQWGG